MYYKDIWLRKAMEISILKSFSYIDQCGVLHCLFKRDGSGWDAGGLSDAAES